MSLITEETFTFTLGFPYLILGIINFVFVFDTHKDFRTDYFSEWLYFVIWGSACFLPVANAVTNLLNQGALVALSNSVLLGTWIWGWIIISSSVWDEMRDHYKPLADLMLAFQIIYILFGSYTVKYISDRGYTVSGTK